MVARASAVTEHELLVVPRSIDRGPFEAGQPQEITPYSSEFRDRSIAAPLKPCVTRMVADYARQFRDRSIAAPLVTPGTANPLRSPAPIPSRQRRGPPKGECRALKNRNL